MIITHKCNGVDHTKTNSANVPFATDESIVKYKAAMDRCSCEDYRRRGGSYYLNGKKVCKHIYRQNTPYALFGAAYRAAAANQKEEVLTNPLTNPFAAFS